MALTKGNKIAVSDVTTALGTKIDTAGTGLSKSGTSLALSTLHSENSTIGSSSAQTLAYSGTFTIPYITRDTYGRVSGGGTRTITMPAKPSSGAATTLSNVAVLTRVSSQMSQKTCTNIGSFTVSYSNADSDGDYPITIKLPSGGTWRWLGIEVQKFSCGNSAGGTTIMSNLYTVRYHRYQSSLTP